MDGKSKWRGRAVLVVLGSSLALIGSGCGGNPAASAPAADPSASRAPSPMTSIAPSASAAATSGVALHGAPGPAPVTLAPMETFATDFPQGVLIAFDSVWTANEFVDTVTRIDPASGEVTEIKATPGLGPQRLAAAGDSIWTSGAGSVDRIDPATNSVTSHIDAGPAVVSSPPPSAASGQRGTMGWSGSIPKLARSRRESHRRATPNYQRTRAAA